MSDINVLMPEDDSYPFLLKSIPNPPGQLYHRGLALSDMPPMVGIIGSRACTEYGETVAYKLGKELAALGFAVVSGMASGVDSYAHQGALDAGGMTVAVLGCGVDVCYPRHNLQLMEDIMQQGCILSEYPAGTRPLGHHFPQRNRIISGLSIGLVVVEASARSGTQTTARYALAQQRKLMAVPGSIFNKQSIGANELLCNGAFAVTSGQDIQRVLSETMQNAPMPAQQKHDASSQAKAESGSIAPKRKPAAEPTIMPEGAFETRLYACIDYEAKNVDILTRLTGMQVKDVLATLSILEIKGLIRHTQGQQFVRTI